MLQMSFHRYSLYNNELYSSDRSEGNFFVLWGSSGSIDWNIYNIISRSIGIIIIFIPTSNFRTQFNRSQSKMQNKKQIISLIK